jgi:hypothetical protein
MNSMAFLLFVSSNPEVDKNQEMELTFGSLSFYIRPSGSTRLSDPTKSVSSAGDMDMPFVYPRISILGPAH